MQDKAAGPPAPSGQRLTLKKIASHTLATTSDFKEVKYIQRNHVGARNVIFKPYFSRFAATFGYICDKRIENASTFSSNLCSFAVK